MRVEDRPRGLTVPDASAGVEGAQRGDGTAVVGIDLGTTNSVVAVVEGGVPVIIPDPDSGNTVPSVVAFRPDGSVLVGEKARRYAMIGPEHTFHSAKRFIGRAADDPTVLEDRVRVAFHVDEDEEEAAVFKCDTVEEGSLYPEEVSAQVLARLLENVQRATGSMPTKAVISVPAYFDEEQRSATVAAAQLAGLETVRLIREPVAAALAYGLDLKDDRTVMVFDLGGGTFDVSILEVGGGVVEVLSTGGDSHLGGDDWDTAISEWIMKEHLWPAGVDTRDPRLKANLRRISEQAKIELSSKTKVVIRMPVGGKDGSGTAAVLTLGKLDKLTADLYRRCQQPMEHACWQAGVDLGLVRGEDTRLADVKAKKTKRQAAKVSNRRMPITEILLVGGATRMPGIKRFLANMTGIEPRDTVNPDEAVAQGAAIQAGILDGQIRDLFVMDVWQASLMRAFAEHQAANNKEQDEDVDNIATTTATGELQVKDEGALVDDFEDDLSDLGFQ